MQRLGHALLAGPFLVGIFVCLHGEDESEGKV